MTAEAAMGVTDTSSLLRLPCPSVPRLRLSNARVHSRRRAAEACTGCGEAAVDRITCVRAPVAEEVREGEKLLRENPRGLPGPTAGSIIGKSLLGKESLEWKAVEAAAAEDVLAGAVVVVLAVEPRPGSEKREVESLVRKLVKDSPRRGRVASRIAGKLAIRKMEKKEALVVDEVPDGENIVKEADLVDIVRRRNSGDPLSSQILIHEADVYSNPPKVLVQDFAGGSTLCTDKHGSTKNSWLFINRPANDVAKRRNRMVGGSGCQEKGRWESDHPAALVEGFPSASMTVYYYRTGGVSTGWCMAEFKLTDQEQGNYMLYKVYHKNNRYPETPTADSSSSPSAETPSIKQGHHEAAEEEDGPSVDASLGSPGAGSDTGLACMDKLHWQAAEKATSCGDLKKACDIHEYAAVKDLFRSIIAELGLDKFITSESLDQLKVRLHHLAMNKELPPKARAVIVSYGQHMWKTLYSAHFNECVRQADFLSKVEGAENERPSPVNSSAMASSFGEKRKADQDHPEAPPSVRQGLTDKDREHLNGADRLLVSDDNINVDSSSIVQVEHQELAKAAEGGSKIGTDEEVAETLPAEWWSQIGWSPGGLFDEPNGDGFLDVPMGDGLLDMSIGDGRLDMNMGDISLPAPAFALCVSELHLAADCQRLHC